jgi:hypothetical protein
VLYTGPAGSRGQAEAGRGRGGGWGGGVRVCNSTESKRCLPLTQKRRTRHRTRDVDLQYHAYPLTTDHIVHNAICCMHSVLVLSAGQRPLRGRESRALLGKVPSSLPTPPSLARGRRLAHTRTRASADNEESVARGSGDNLPPFLSSAGAFLPSPVNAPPLPPLPRPTSLHLIPRLPNNSPSPSPLYLL